MPHHRKLAWGWIIDLWRVRLPKLPPPSPKQVEERLKLGASGLQTMALAVITADFIAPVLNPGRQVSIWLHILATIPACIAIVAAHILLRYIPPPTPPKEGTDV